MLCCLGSHSLAHFSLSFIARRMYAPVSSLRFYTVPIEQIDVTDNLISMSTHCSDSFSNMHKQTSLFRSIFVLFSMTLNYANDVFYGVFREKSCSQKETVHQHWRCEQLAHFNLIQRAITHYAIVKNYCNLYWFCAQSSWDSRHQTNVSNISGHWRWCKSSSGCKTQYVPYSAHTIWAVFTFFNHVSHNRRIVRSNSRCCFHPTQIRFLLHLLLKRTQKQNEPPAGHSNRHTWKAGLSHAINKTLTNSHPVYLRHRKPPCTKWHPQSNYVRRPDLSLLNVIIGKFKLCDTTIWRHLFASSMFLDDFSSHYVLIAAPTSRVETIPSLLPIDKGILFPQPSAETTHRSQKCVKQYKN